MRTKNKTINKQASSGIKIGGRKENKMRKERKRGEGGITTAFI